MGRGDPNNENTPDEKPSDLEAERERIEEKIYANEANENIIERTLEWEQLTEQQDAILDDIEASNKQEN